MLKDNSTHWQKKLGFNQPTWRWIFILYQFSCRHLPTEFNQNDTQPRQLYLIYTNQPWFKWVRLHQTSYPDFRKPEWAINLVWRGLVEYFDWCTAACTHIFKVSDHSVICSLKMLPSTALTVLNQSSYCFTKLWWLVLLHKTCFTLLLLICFGGYKLISLYDIMWMSKLSKLLSSL